MKTLRIFLFTLVVFNISFLANAQSGSAKGYIKSLTIKESGDVFIAYENPHANPYDCEQSSHIVIVDSDPNKRDMLSIALSALHTGKKVSAWNTECISRYSKTYPKVVTITVYK